MMLHSTDYRMSDNEKKRKYKCDTEFDTDERVLTEGYS